EQERQDVAAPRGPFRAAPRHLGVQDVVDRARPTDVPAPRGEPTQLELREGKHQEGGGRAVHQGEEVLEAATEFGELRTVVDAEDGADDDVEGDGLHLVMDRGGTA